MLSAQTGKVSTVSDFPSIAGGTQAFLELSFPAAARTPQGGLADIYIRRGDFGGNLSLFLNEYNAWTDSTGFTLFLNDYNYSLICIIIPQSRH